MHQWGLFWLPQNVHTHLQNQRSLISPNKRERAITRPEQCYMRISHYWILIHDKIKRFCDWGEMNDFGMCDRRTRWSAQVLTFILQHVSAFFLRSCLSVIQLLMWCRRRNFMRLLCILTRTGKRKKMTAGCWNRKRVLALSGHYICLVRRMWRGFSC